MLSDCAWEGVTPGALAHPHHAVAVLACQLELHAAPQPAGLSAHSVTVKLRMAH